MSTTNGLFIPSGARVALVGLPPIDRPIRLADGRAFRLRDMQTAPVGPNGELGQIQFQFWTSSTCPLRLGISLDETEAWGPLLHVSVSHENVRTDPSWKDLTAIKDAVFGDVDAAMILPKREDYVNLRTNCFHLWQIPQRWGIR